MIEVINTACESTSKIEKNKSDEGSSRSLGLPSSEERRDELSESELKMMQAGQCLAECEKKLKQAQHRLEEAQARETVKERKRRTRRLIIEGAILEKIFPTAAAMSPYDLEHFLQKLL